MSRGWADGVLSFAALVFFLWFVCAENNASAAEMDKYSSSDSSDKPNFVVIFGDDIGITNISAYSMGLMGYKTPNIDSLGKEGMMFIDYYSEQTCTAGRSSFITGQSPLRTGMSKVSLPGGKIGLSQKDPTLAALLKGQGYATAQFGKNHLGDRNEFLPTVHGFDEFYGSLYHLNAEEEPEAPNYPKNPEFFNKYGPRGVLHTKAIEVADETVDKRFGKIGKQTIKDTGALTKKRMETIDDEIATRAANYIKNRGKDGKPFFVWVNFTRMHLYTHIKKERLGQAGENQSFYHDGMIDHDRNVGEVIKAVKQAGLGDNTVIMYTGDNGPQMNSWPDAGTTWFRSEKNTGWEGAYRAPCLVRYPPAIKPGTVTTEIASHLDWVPTFMAMAGEPKIKEKLKKGHESNGKNYKVHLDGFNLLPFLSGQTDKSPRFEFFYISDDGEILALRHKNFKVHFFVQDQEGTAEIWQREYRRLRIPLLFNLRTDPFERSSYNSNVYWDWYIRNAFLVLPSMERISLFLNTFKEFPPRQGAPSLSPDKMLEQIRNASAN